LAEKFDSYERALRRIPVIRISGSGKFSEDEFEVSGSGRVIGDLKTKLLRVSGSLSVDGLIEAHQISVSGSASFNDKVSCDMMSISGSCRVDGDLTISESMVSSGSLKVFGNLKSDGLIDVRGRIVVNGSVKAKTFLADLKGTSEIKRGIEADDIEIRSTPRERGIVVFGVTILGFRGGEGRLYTSNIRAKNRVYIEGVICDSVEGSDVEIGRGCEVKGKVLFRNSVKVHEGAKLSSPPEKLEE